tara:strand:+ start:147 stop:554 length:408 start_codon:yes stop_codon:yes gene_type:complete
MRIGISLLIVLIISAALGYAFRNVLGFFETAILAAFLQLIAPSVWNAIFKHKEKVLQLESEINYLVELNTAEVDCPCGNYKFNEIVVITDSTVESKCPKCGGVYRLVPSVKAILTTEVVDVNKKPFDDIKIGKEI